MSNSPLPDHLLDLMSLRAQAEAENPLQRAPQGLPVQWVPQNLWNQFHGVGSGGAGGSSGGNFGPGGGGGAGVSSGWVSFPGGGGGGAQAPFRHSGRLKMKRMKYLPDTMGWRGWKIADVMDISGNAFKKKFKRSWDVFCKAERGLYLQSPQQNTVWEGPELRCERWDKDEAVRGASGIHALLAPECWRDLEWEYQIGDTPVTGLVERFGKFILGEDGWRAEWVIIRELQVPDRKVATELARTYPEVTIHIDGE
jgi:hypothetical protein